MTWRAGCRDCGWHGPSRNFTQQLEADIVMHVNDKHSEDARKARKLARKAVKRGMK